MYQAFNQNTEYVVIEMADWPQDQGFGQGRDFPHLEHRSGFGPAAGKGRMCRGHDHVNARESLVQLRSDEHDQEVTIWPRDLGQDQHGTDLADRLIGEGETCQYDVAALDHQATTFTSASVYESSAESHRNA